MVFVLKASKFLAQFACAVMGFKHIIFSIQFGIKLKRSCLSIFTPKPADDVRLLRFFLFSPLLGHTSMLVNGMVVYRYQLAAFLLPHISPQFPTQNKRKRNITHKHKQRNYDEEKTFHLTIYRDNILCCWLKKLCQCD